MNVHEYQAKEVLKKYGIPIPDFIIASSVEEARHKLKEKGWQKGVVKVQVHAGGRGKAGGVKFGNSPQEILQRVEELLGLKIVNNQTGPEGMVAHKVMISPSTDIKKEYYIGAVINRNQGKAMLMASPEGGMDIEEVAEKYPDRIVTVPIENDGSVHGYHLIRLAKVMGWDYKPSDSGMIIAKGLAKAFIETDASTLEINPLVETTNGELLALDAKLTVDDNALFRQKEIAEWYDPTQVPANEREAQKHDLAYIAMDGNIGCMVNGAGLAMATMDIIQHFGGKPANFLDVGGGASKEKVAAGFKIILSDPKVKAVLVNIFGGIMNCQTITEGVIAAADELHIKVPLVVRMEGTNVEMGRKTLEESSLNIITAEDLAEAAEKVVKSIR